MKKIFSLSLLAVAFIATLLMTGCQKDGITTLRARIGQFGGNGKVYLSGYVPIWSVGDNLWVNEQPAEVVSVTGGEANITVPSTTTYRLIYPYSIVTNVVGNNATLDVPRVQLYSVDGQDRQVVNAPMAAVTTTSSVRFNNLGAILAININNNRSDNLDIDSVVVTSAGHTLPLSGTAIVEDISSDAPYYVCQSTIDTNYYSVALKKLDPNNSNAYTKLFTLNSGNSKPVYVYVPAHGTHDNHFRIIVYAKSGSNPVVIGNTQKSMTGGNMERNQMASVPFDLRTVVAPTGAIADGMFTVGVDANNKPIRVYFASGNLQCKRTINGSDTTYTWRIAPHQYDVIGNGTGTGNYGNVSGSTNSSINDNTYTGWIDLFGWATSGYHNPNDTYNQRYQPFHYKHSFVNNDNYYGYGPSISMTNNITLDGTNASYDWGVYHSNPASGSNSNGGLMYVNENNTHQIAGPGATWRTLSATEWSYLLTERVVNGAAGEHHSWSGVTYMGKNGLLIYPDDYQLQLTSSSQRHYDFDAEHVTTLPAALASSRTLSMQSESRLTTAVSQSANIFILDAR